MALTALQKKARRRGQARIDQQKIDKFRRADPSSALRDDEILARKPKKKRKKRDPDSVVREGEGVKNIFDVGRELAKRGTFK